jgi:hypothetical protein
MDEEALLCMLYVSHVTGISVSKILSWAAKDWYDVQGESLMQQVERQGRTGGANRSRGRKPKAKNFAQVITMTDEIRARALGVKL